jgi:hypothetical protein
MKIRILSAENPPDYIHFELPAFIRVLEIAREHMKTDDDLHVFVEGLMDKYREVQAPLETNDVSSVFSE